MVRGRSGPHSRETPRLFSSREKPGEGGNPAGGQTFAPCSRGYVMIALALMRQPYGSHVQKRSVVSKLAWLRLAPADEVFGQPGRQHPQDIPP